VAISILLDGRTVDRHPRALVVLSAVHDARKRPTVLGLLLRLALANKPNRVSPRHRRRAIRRAPRGLRHLAGGLLPIVGITRYAGLAAGATSTSTVSRLQAAGAAGVLPQSDATRLEEAWRLMTELRMEDHVRQLEEGSSPDDYVDPKALDALTRRNLREAFRLVASIQKRLDPGGVWKG
jgi:CBS domain-containing protein